MGAPILPLALLALFAALLAPAARALVFHLPSGSVKCITNELHAGAMSVAHYRLADDTLSHDHKISARVSDPQGESVHQAEDVESGQFAFVAADAGQYTACFWIPKFELLATVAMDFEWKIGIAAKEWPSVAKKGKIEVIELELKKLEDLINSIREEMIFLHEREEEARILIENMNSRMGILGLLSLIICGGVAGLQLLHLKTFFVREKIL